jgi:hypothetical protein
MRLLAIFLLLLLPLGTVRAQSDIHRCVGANGGVIFTDRVCSDLNATPAVPAPTSSVSASPSASIAIAQPPPVLCASDIEELKQAVVDAFAARNPNRLAGLMLWDGDGRDSVVANIREFTRMMAHPLVEVRASEYTSPPPASSSSMAADPSVLSMSAAPSPSPRRGESLSVETEADDGSGATQETHFGVVHHAGCVWLEPPY